MPNLTKKDVEQLLAAQTKQLTKRLDPLETLLRQNTTILRQTTALMTHLVEGADEFKTDVKTVRSTLESHTITLDSIHKNTRDWEAVLNFQRTVPFIGSKLAKLSACPVE